MYQGRSQGGGGGERGATPLPGKHSKTCVSNFQAASFAKGTLIKKPK